MPTIRTENPRTFKAKADEMLSIINGLEKSIILRHRDAQVIICGDCGAKAPVNTARLRADGQALCHDCLPKWGYCEETHRYHPASEVHTYFDATSMEREHCPKQMHVRNGRHNTFTCAECKGEFYGSNVNLRDGAVTKKVCMVCANSKGFRCEGCHVFYVTEIQADNCCGDRQHHEYRDPKMDFKKGTDFARFSERPVGMEIETGQGGRTTKVLRWLNKNLPEWGMMGDGSLCEGGYEYVSCPMTGNVIEDSYRGFARAMMDREVTVEHQRAGYHVHVNAKDIYDYIGKLQNDGKSREADACEDMMQKWGTLMIALSSEMVAPWRRQSCFCQGAFGYRASKGGYPRQLKKARGVSYPPVAIRQNTLEFRIFPSTANIDWHLARTEMAQKSVDFLFNAMKNPDEKVQMERFFQAMSEQRGLVKVDLMCCFLDISEPSRRSLQKMHKTWTPAEYEDGKPCGNEYKREPKSRKPRSRTRAESSEEMAS